MEKKTTRKELFARIKETMAGDAEVVAMCDKYIETLSKPAKVKPKPEVLEFRAALTTFMSEQTEPMTNKAIAEALEVNSQRCAAGLRFLVGEGLVLRDESTKPVTFTFVKEEDEDLDF